jgi:FkbM family methyltransferase
MIGSLLYDLNHASIWHRELKVWNQRLRATSLDRLVFLGLHRFGLMGSKEGRLLERLVKPGMATVDIGANIGLYALFLAHLAGRQGRVFAFEPEPTLFAMLCENCAANGAENITPFQIAAGETNGRAVFQRAIFNSGDNGLGPARADAQPLEVEVARLDDVLPVRAVDFIKIDVQGHELTALSGMPKLLSASPDVRMLFEFCPFGLRAANTDPQSLLDFFRDRGFELYETKTGQLQHLSDPRQLLTELQGKQYINLLASRSRPE